MQLQLQIRIQTHWGVFQWIINSKSIGLIPCLYIRSLTPRHSRRSWQWWQPNWSTPWLPWYQYPSSSPAIHSGKIQLQIQIQVLVKAHIVTPWSFWYQVFHILSTSQVSPASLLKPSSPFSVKSLTHCLQHRLLGLHLLDGDLERRLRLHARLGWQTFNYLGKSFHW